MKLQARHRKTVSEFIRKSLPPTEEMFLRFGACILKIRANDSEILEGLRVYFHPFVVVSGVPTYTISVHETDAVEVDLPLIPKEPDPGKSRIKEEFIDLPDGRIVRKRLTGVVFVFGAEDHIAVGPCKRNLNQIVNFINNRYIQWLLHEGGLLAHASGVLLHGFGIAIAGFSGMGKSTLSLHLLGIGADFVSNDRLVLERKANEVIMHGVAKLPRINPGTILNNPSLFGMLSERELQRYARMSVGELWTLEEKNDVPLDRCFPNSRFVLSAHLHALVILNWKRQDRPMDARRVFLDERKDLLQAFRKSTGLFFLNERTPHPVDPTDDAYIDRLGDIAVYEITGGVDFQAAVAFCRSLLHASKGVEAELHQPVGSMPCMSH